MDNKRVMLNNRKKGKMRKRTECMRQERTKKRKK